MGGIFRGRQDGTNKRIEAAAPSASTGFPEVVGGTGRHLSYAPDAASHDRGGSHCVAAMGDTVDPPVPD